MSRNLGEFEQFVLFALLKLKDTAYGAAIRSEIALAKTHNPSWVSLLPYKSFRPIWMGPECILKVR